MPKMSHKPVRKCHACKLNRGEHCWIYLYPRYKWSNGKRCPAYNHPLILRELEHWLKYQPEVKSKKELRRGLFRSRRKFAGQSELPEEEIKRILSYLQNKNSA